LARVPSTVREMMTKKVITMEPDQPIIEAAKLIKAKNIGSVVVVDKGMVIGILTESNFVRIIVEGHDPSTTRVKEVMSTPVVTCSPDTPAPEIAKIMRNKRVRHIPVVENGNLVGIVSSFDFGWYAYA